MMATLVAFLSHLDAHLQVVLNPETKAIKILENGIV